MTTEENGFLRLEDLDVRRDAIHVMPLGGLGEIGMNCTLIECAGDIVMVDCGMMMPDEEMLGVDYVIPDMSVLEGHEDRLKAILITHAHEDHVGALPYILTMFPKVPVYGTELVVAMLKEKMREHKISPNFKIYEPRVVTRINETFQVEPISVTHSMIDAVALAVRTPAGVVIHTGDFKIDPNPPDGVAFDHYSFARYAEEEEDGVLLLMSDSTNADRRGTCPSEMEVLPGLEAIFREAENAIILSTFASSLHRIQNVLNVAAKYEREVVALGLNMERNIRIASKLEALDIPCKYHDDPRMAMKIPRERRLILCTGSQGEAMSSLSRLSTGAHRDARVEEGDTVILSARRIPGNESAIYRIINHLTRRGAHVIHEGMAMIHVSGHGYRDDMKHMINLVNPRYFVPVHGEYRHLSLHCQIAQGQGLRPDETFLIENGTCLQLSAKSARRVGRVPHGRVFVDGKGIGEVDEYLLRDRRYLAKDGLVVVVLNVDHESGEVLGEPVITTRGIALGEDEDDARAALREVVVNSWLEMGAESRTEAQEVQAEIKKAVRRHIKRHYEQYPVILPVVMEL